MESRQRPRKLLAIDWDARMLRIVCAALGRRRTARVVRIVSVAIPADVNPGDPAQMGGLIRRALDQEGIYVRHAVVDIPRNQSFLNTLKLPLAAPEELPGIVEIQIAKELPFPLSEAVVDFAVGPHESGATVGEVLVAAVRREVLRKYEETFEAAELKLDRIGLRPYANKVAVDHLLRHAMPERVVFIDVGPTFTEINVLRNGFLAFSRSAEVAVSAAASSERPALSLVRPDDEPSEIGLESADYAAPVGRTSVIPSLVMEVTRSVEAYRAKDPGAKIDHVVVGGDIGVEEELVEAIQKRLGVTAEIYNPRASFGWSPEESANTSAYASTLGLVLGYTEDGALQFDFLHPKKTVSATRKRLKKAPMAAAVAVVFIAAVSVGIANVTGPQRRELANLEKQIRELSANKSRNETFLRFAEQVSAFDSKQLVWVDVLYDVVSQLPSTEEFVLNHVDMNQKDNRIVLKTRSKKRGTPLEVLHKLEAFRREGRERPRFSVSMGPQAEKKGEKYPFTQDLRIRILDDETSDKDKAKKSGSRSDRRSATTSAWSPGVGAAPAFEG